MTRGVLVPQADRARSMGLRVTVHEKPGLACTIHVHDGVSLNSYIHTDMLAAGRRLEEFLDRMERCVRDGKMHDIPGVVDYR